MSDLHFGWRWGAITWPFLRLCGCKQRSRNDAEGLYEALLALEKQKVKPARAKGMEVRLVVTGDLLHSTKVGWRQLNQAERGCIDIKRRWSKQLGVTTTITPGDHDPEPLQLLEVFGLKVAGHEYHFSQNGIAICATHYNQFERKGWLQVLLGELIVYAVMLLGAVDWLLRRGRYCDYALEIERRSLDYAAQRGADIISGGHTHNARMGKRGGIVHLNTGCHVRGYPHCFGLKDGKSLKLLHYEGKGRFICLAEAMFESQARETKLEAAY